MDSSIRLSSRIDDDLKERLKVTGEAEIMILGITVIPDNPQKMTINLRAPLVINVESRLGEQVILADDHYEIRYPVLWENGAKGV